jgi:DNA polymerase
MSTAGGADASAAAVSAAEPADWQEADSVAALEEAISGCLKCPLGHTRTRFVFGSGNPDADIMIVGEAPGADEDAQGLPFVGRAGQLLTKILEAIQLSRDEVFICNILKCRPPNNRKPLVSETDECEPYLWKQIELIRPRFILAVGLTAANTLLRNKASMSALRGSTHDYHGIPMIVTYHPAALLRNPEWKVHTWEDVKLLRRLYDESKASS